MIKNPIIVEPGIVDLMERLDAVVRDTHKFSETKAGRHLKRGKCLFNIETSIDEAIGHLAAITAEYLIERICDSR